MMQEEAQTLFPARRPLLLLAVLWLLCVIGIVFFGGINLRGLCGSVFSLVLLWLSYLDLRDGMLYDCITVPFALLGLLPALAGLISLQEILIGGTLCGVLFYCLYIAAHGGLGGGDVKLAAALGLWLGWEAAVIAVWIAFVRGAGGDVTAFHSDLFYRSAAILPLLQGDRSGSSIGGSSDEGIGNAGRRTCELAGRALCICCDSCGSASSGIFTLRTGGSGV